MYNQLEERKKLLLENLKNHFPSGTVELMEELFFGGNVDIGNLSYEDIIKLNNSKLTLDAKRITFFNLLKKINFVTEDNFKETLPFINSQSILLLPKNTRCLYLEEDLPRLPEGEYYYFEITQKNGYYKMMRKEFKKGDLIHYSEGDSYISLKNFRIDEDYQEFDKCEVEFYTNGINANITIYVKGDVNSATKYLKYDGDKTSFIPIGYNNAYFIVNSMLSNSELPKNVVYTIENGKGEVLKTVDLNKDTNFYSFSLADFDLNQYGSKFIIRLSLAE